MIAVEGLTALVWLHSRGVAAPGGVAEWSKAAVLKTADREVRGFESLRLRQIFEIAAIRARLTTVRRKKVCTGVVTEWPKVLDC